jgi:hypothetical protein
VDKKEDGRTRVQAWAGPPTLPDGLSFFGLGLDLGTLLSTPSMSSSGGQSRACKKHTSGNWFEGNRLTAFEGELTGPISKRHFGVPRRLRETASQTRPVSIGHPQDSRKQLCRRAWFGSMGPKSLGLKELAEREGFEPSVQVLARTTV